MSLLALIIHCSDQPEDLFRTLTDVSTFMTNHPHVQALLISDWAIDRGNSLFKGFEFERINILENSDRQGFGGNQKIGFQYAIRQGFEMVSVIRTSSPVDSHALTFLSTYCESNVEADCFLGTPYTREGWPRVIVRPFETCVSAVANPLAGVHLKGWRASVRAYKTSALQNIVYDLNANTDVFETEILLQLIKHGCKILDVSLPSVSPPRPRRSNLFDALEIAKACMRYRLQKYNLFYDFRYHPENVFSDTNEAKTYESKLEFNSPHTFVCQDPSAIPIGAKVLDIGSSSGYVARALSEQKHCQVTAIDQLPASQVQTKGFQYLQFDLESETDRLCAFIEKNSFDVILMLDLLEHLSKPEVFLLKLYRIPYMKKPRFIFSTGNVSFFVIRIMLLFGYFNYGEKGILDITHKRLFTWRTFQNLFDQTGFVILRKCSFPAPYQFLGFGPSLSRFCGRVNAVLIRLRPSLFAYQILLIAAPFNSPQKPLDH